MICVFGNCLLPLEFGVLEKVFLLLDSVLQDVGGNPSWWGLYPSSQMSNSRLLYYFAFDIFSEG